MLFRIYMTSENGYSMVFRKRIISSFILYIISSNSMFEIQNRRNLIFYGVSDDLARACIPLALSEKWPSAAWKTAFL